MPKIRSDFIVFGKRVLLPMRITKQKAHIM